jgi:hypothetical protein
LGMFPMVGLIQMCLWCLLCVSDDPLSRNSQAQAAEDILDKYRNIKRTSPSEGATAAAYDATGQCLSRSGTPTHTHTHYINLSV